MLSEGALRLARIWSGWLVRGSLRLGRIWLTSEKRLWLAWLFGAP